MPSRPPAGTAYARISIFGESDQKEFSNIFWYSAFSGSPSPSFDSFAMGAAFLANVQTPYQDCLTTSTFIRGIRCEISDGTVVVAGDTYTALSGSVVGDFLPGDVAAVVQKVTAVAGKQGRGRWYFACVPEPQTQGSYLEASGITAFTALATALQLDIPYAGHAGPVVMRPAHFSPGLGTLNAINSAPIVGLLATRRRRRGPF